ncbi:MAG: WD40/YVTN/BNR-like repeat-containing protein [Bryobacteraceae bacterium]
MINRLPRLHGISTFAALTLTTFVIAGTLTAQDERKLHHVHPWVPNSSVSNNHSIQTLQPSVAPRPLNSTSWVNIGPAPVTADPTSEATPDSGRVNGIAAHPTDPNTIYVAAAGGGVWKTINGGTTWAPLTDTQKTLAMGALAMAPSDSNVLYAGTGEPDSGGDFGRGVLVTTDGGANWTLQTNNGVFDRVEVSEIAIDPNNAKVAYVATSSCCGTNTDSSKVSGVYKTMNGGATWTNTTRTVSTVSWSSVRIDPGGPSTLYAAVGDTNGRDDNGVYKTTNGGGTWTKLANAPSGVLTGRMVVAVSKSASSVVYVSAESQADDSLYKFMRSDDGGATFTDLTPGTPNYLGHQGNFDTTLIVDPKNSAIVYAGGDSNPNGLIRSTDSGKTWKDISGTSSNGANGPHVDHHSSAFDANGKFLDGDDGGIFRYDPAVTNRTKAWTALQGNLSTVTVEGIGLHPTNDKIVVAGTQDNGAVRYSGSLDWSEVTCGDGGKVRFSKQDSSRVYIQCPQTPDGFFQRSDDAGLTWAFKVNGITDNTSSTQNFYAPFAVDPNGGNRVLFGGKHVFETTDGGENWTALVGSPSCAMPSCGEFANRIDALDLSASHPNTIYVAAGPNLFVTTDNGKVWNQRDLPVAGKVTSIQVFPGHNLRAVVTIGQFTTGAYVFHTIDGGMTWTDITGNLPKQPVFSAQFHGDSIKTLYVGAEDGVYKTTDAGGTWLRFGSGLPNAQVFDIQLDTALGLFAAGTYGRGVWEIKLPPPTTTSVSNEVGTPNELITLKADVKPAGVPGTVKFEVDGVAIPGTATYDRTTGHAGQEYIIPASLSVGKHQITADFVSSNDSIGGNSGGVGVLTVK